MAGKTVWDSRATLSSILEILAIFSRADLKTEVMKELERQIAVLERLDQVPGVDRTRLTETLDIMDGLIDRLYASKGQIGQELRTNEFLNAIRQRSTIPGGTCDFDLPGYHYWLQQSIDTRQHDLGRWAGTLEAVRASINLILKLLRESAGAQSELATGGILQKTFETNVAFQLLRVMVPSELPYYVEVSGSKHRFSMRFMEFSTTARARQTDQDVHFKLACCAL